MCKINSIVFIFILSFSYCFNEVFIPNEEFNHKIKQIEDHFQRIFDQMNNELTKLKEHNWNTCGEDWISYSDRKCFKVLENKGSIDEAKENCSDIGSSLITILSKEEQSFLSATLENFNNISDNVWIGLELSENSYKWLDGNQLKYENWDENSDKKQKCVEMSITKSSSGKWTDDLCHKKYLIICQKKQNTKTVFNEELKNLTKVIERQENQIKTQKSDFIQEISKQQKVFEDRFSKQQNQINSQKTDFFQELSKQQNQIKTQENKINSLIPIGFLYTQLPNQASPQELWPKMEWSDITSQYSGLFFRAEGGGSLPFGQIQLANQSHISDVYFKGCKLQMANGKEIHESACDKQFASLNRGNWYGVFDGNVRAVVTLDFFKTGGEVRPKNTAIKIFKRIQ